MANRSTYLMFSPSDGQFKLIPSIFYYYFPYKNMYNKQSFCLRQQILVFTVLKIEIAASLKKMNLF